MPPRPGLLPALTLTLVVGSSLTLRGHNVSQGDHDARQAQWSPRRCVTDTLSVLRDSIGIATIVAQLEELNGRFPPRFQPADLLVEMARSNLRFYGD